MRWLFAALLFAGCGRLGYDEGGAAFAKPQRIDELSSTARDLDPALTADQLLIYFDSDREGGAGGTDLWFSSRASASDRWDPPRPATELNGVDEDTTPHLSADGLTIWYGSRRPGVNNVSVLVATRRSRDVPFDAPVILATAIDTAAGEFSPTLFAGDTRLIYCSDRTERGSLDLWETLLVGDEWQAPSNRGDLNSASDDGAPAVYGGGLKIALAREVEGGDDDLFIATRDGLDERWGPAEPIAELNDDDKQSGPWLSDDGLTIFYDSGEDLYWSQRAIDVP